MEDKADAILFSRNPLDITRPRIITIDGYRIRDFVNYDEVPTKPVALAPYVENDDMVSCMELEDNFDISITKSGKFVIQFHIAPIFFRNIIGARGSIRNKLEQETRTYIKIPRQGETEDIIISGRNERDVVTAKNRIDLIVLQARDKQAFTHFLSVPMVSDMIKHNFEVFKNSILTGPLVRGLHESMFQNPNKLHLTITTLTLLDDVEQEEAKKALRQCKEEVVIPLFESVEPLQITMRGVEIMNDDPTNVDVLYGKVKIEPPKYNDTFQKLVNNIIDYFAHKGLIRKQYGNVKLHVTLINSLFRRDNETNATKNVESKQKREPFDAEPILAKYKNYHFGEVNLNFLHLSIRFTTSEGSYYEALSTVPIT